MFQASSAEAGCPRATYTRQSLTVRRKRDGETSWFPRHVSDQARASEQVQRCHAGRVPGGRERSGERIGPPFAGFGCSFAPSVAERRSQVHDPFIAQSHDRQATHAPKAKAVSIADGQRKGRTALSHNATAKREGKTIRRTKEVPVPLSDGVFCQGEHLPAKPGTRNDGKASGDTLQDAGGWQGRSCEPARGKRCGSGSTIAKRMTRTNERREARRSRPSRTQCKVSLGKPPCYGLHALPGASVSGQS